MKEKLNFRRCCCYSTLLLPLPSGNEQQQSGDAGAGKKGYPGAAQRRNSPRALLGSRCLCGRMPSVRPGRP